MVTEYKPKMRVRITLSATWQNKLLSLLHSHLDIAESFPEEHTIYMTSEKFVNFLFTIENNDVSCSLAQMKAEYVDMNKIPRITVVRHYGMSYEMISKDVP